MAKENETVVPSTLDVSEASESLKRASKDKEAKDKSLADLLAKQKKEEGKAHENSEGNDKRTS